MSIEKTLIDDGSFLVAKEENRSWVQLFPIDQSKDAGVWVIRYRQDIRTFRSTSFPLSAVSHTGSAKTLINPNTGALTTMYLVGETITSIEGGNRVVFERVYAPEISDTETVSAQAISIPDWNGLEEDGTYSATIDNRRTAIYTARKAVSAISELQEIETITTADVRATIHGTIDIDGTTSDLTQSVDDIWADLFLIAGLVSVQKSSTKLRLNSNLDSVDTYDVSITGMQSGTGYIVSKTNATGASYIEIEFVYTRSIVSGFLTLQSRDPKIIYSSNFSAGVDSWTSANLTLAGNIDGIGGQNDCLRLTKTTTGTDFAYPATPTAPGSGVYFCKCDVYIPSSGGVNAVYLRTYGASQSSVVIVTNQWVTISWMETGAFANQLKSIYATGAIGTIFYVKNFTFETIDRTLDLSDTIDDLYTDLNLGGAVQSIIKDSENVIIRFDPDMSGGSYFIDTYWISASLANGTSYVSHEITQVGPEFKIAFHDDRQAAEVTTNPQSVRTLTVTSHGLIQGDVVALFAGDALVGVTTCTAVIDTNSFQIPANALPGKDDIVTHIGDKSTQSTFSSYPQTVLVTTRKKVYIPGVTAGVDTLDDIPVRQGLDTPQSWLIAITESLATAQIDGTLIEHPYPGLYIATESEFAMADVLNQTDSFLADVDGTLLLVDW